MGSEGYEPLPAGLMVGIRSSPDRGLLFPLPILNRDFVLTTRVVAVIDFSAKLDMSHVISKSKYSRTQAFEIRRYARVFACNICIG